MFGRKQREQEQVRDFGGDVAALEAHARQLATTEALESMTAYTQANGPVWADSDHRTVNR